MKTYVQQEFQWPEAKPPAEQATPPPNSHVPMHQPAEVPPAPALDSVVISRDPFIDVPLAKPLPQAVEHGVFGTTTEGPIEPDTEEAKAMTEEQGRELAWILRDLQAVEDAARTREDPRTGRTPKTDEAGAKLREFLEAEEPRLKQAYASSLAAYANGFGDDAAKALDQWVRKIVADCTIPPANRYNPGHPWHYLSEGDNAAPMPIDEIEPDIDVGRYVERELPKNPAKRAEKLRAMRAHEQDRLEEDKRRYQEIIDRGAEALSRYDREIAHTSDEMAVATALALKFNHIRYGLGRVLWIQEQLTNRFSHPERNR